MTILKQKIKKILPCNFLSYIVYECIACHCHPDCFISEEHLGERCTREFGKGKNLEAFRVNGGETPVPRPGLQLHSEVQPSVEEPQLDSLLQMQINQASDGQSRWEWNRLKVVLYF